MCVSCTPQVHRKRFWPPYRGCFSEVFWVYWTMRQSKTPLAQRPHSHVLPLTAKFALNDYERVRADAATHGLPVSSYIRQKALSGTVQPPVVISPICQEQWHQLALVGTNLNRLLYLLNSGVVGPELADLRPTVEEAHSVLRAVRSQLIGVTLLRHDLPSNQSD
jgi:hypothetical protein